MDIRFEPSNKAIHLYISAGNAGRLRFKKRDKMFGVGKSFSTREGTFDNSVYLEWQIGYDTTLKDLEIGKKRSSLTAITFTGSNGKQKYPYELSELVFVALDNGLVTVEDISNLLSEISGYQAFIDEKEMITDECLRITLNGIGFNETCIKLPTLFMNDTADETQIEISVEKQQYATGVQPMLYFCIPLTAFANGSTLLGRSSSKGDELLYVIDERSAINLLLLMKVFAMASKRHHHDITEILKLLIKLAKK